MTRRAGQSAGHRYLAAPTLFHPQRMGLKVRTGVVTLALLSAALVALPASASAGNQGPDRAFRTPIAHGAATAPVPKNSL
jgi:hypothetical protein